MDQAIRFQPLNMEAWIYGGKSGTETDFFLSTLVLPCIIQHCPIFLFHSSITDAVCHQPLKVSLRRVLMSFCLLN